MGLLDSILAFLCELSYGVIIESKKCGCAFITDGMIRNHCNIVHWSSRRTCIQVM